MNTQKTILSIIVVLAIIVGGYFILRQDTGLPATENSGNTGDVSNVAPTPTPPHATATGGCYIGGCSSQICSDQKDATSSCEYKAEYACYQSGTCERQPSGDCGWTQTTELMLCLGVEIK